jgi:hypothetical protein
MSSQLVFDEEAARRIEAIYVIGDAVRRRRIVRDSVGASTAERILDGRGRRRGARSVGRPGMRRAR